MSRLVESSDVGATTESTTVAVRWQAPEFLQSNIFSAKSDVWSFGVLMYEVVERKVPYGNKILTQITIEIANGTLSLPDIKNERLNQNSSSNNTSIRLSRTNCCLSYLII